MQLSPHFSLREATYSYTAIKHGIDNTANAEQLERMKYTALKMEVVRQLLDNRPITITSWLRNMQVNHLVGGSPTSQHSKGEAVDFQCPGFGNVRDICLELMANKKTLGYDQLILEPTWVHISFTLGHNRGRELTYISKNTYKEGIT